MIHSIRRLCSVLFLAICCSYSNAQTVNADGTETTGNLIDNSQWTGAVYGTDPNDCCSNPGGSQPLYDTASDTIKFSYGHATVGQIIGINSALSGTGIQINGYTWQYDARNMNGSGGQNGTDTLTSYSYLRDGNSATLTSNTITHNTQFEWTTFSGTQTLANPYSISGGGTVGIQFSGSDGGFWAGLYGPEVRNVGLRLNYTSGPDPCTVDPLSSTSCPGYAEAYKSQQCSINPLYDTTCPGYAEAYFAQQCSFNPLYDLACPGNSAVIASGNLVPRPGSGTGFFGGWLNNSFAINTALSHGGAGVMVHGFQWGYRATNYSVFGSSLGSSTVNVNIRNGDGTSLYAWSRNNTASGERNYSSSYILPQSINNLDMGNFDFTATSTGWGYVDRMWARALITPDQCTLDPLSSVLCTGYQAAFLDQQCSLNTLYSPSCPGYNDALKAMLEEQAALAAAATSSSTTTTDPTSTASTGSTGTSSAAATGTQDPTKTDATVTTDVGGVELTTTGEIVVADSVPATVKEAAKETTKTQEAAKETTTASSTSTTATEKKTTRVNALAIAQSAAREAEATAKATAEAAVAQSQSAAANPSDGTGATVNLGGITLDSLRSMTSAGQDRTATAAVNRAAQQAVAVRSLSADSESRANTDDDRPVAVTTADPLQDTVNRTVSAANYSLLPQQTDERVEDRSKSTAGTGMRLEQLAVMPAIPEEPKAPTGPSVRRGGAVDGMSGGDMNALAAAPANFNDYLTQQMQDSQFYASREIYRGQRNVDNARALRGLGTDRLHQEMVNQQYNISGQ